MDSLRHDSSYHRDAKEYARFCRIHRIFLVDGIGPWTDALKARGVSDAAVVTKVSAAARFVRLLADTPPRVAVPRQPDSPGPV